MVNLSRAHTWRTANTQNDNWKVKLLSNWHIVVGDLSSKVTIEKIQKDSLTLGVRDSCWLQELYLISPVLLKTINQTLDHSRIKQLRFKVIGIKKKTKKKKSTQISIQKNVILKQREKNALEKSRASVKK